MLLLATWLMMAPLAAVAAQQGGAPPSTLVNLFPRGEHNVSCYFGPILFPVVPDTAVLVALTEARLFSCNDQGPKRIAMRRSEDNGASWAPIQWIFNDTVLEPVAGRAARWSQWLASGGNNFTGSNFGSIFFDKPSGTLSLFFTFGKVVMSDVDMLVISSKDARRTWSAARNASASVRAPTKQNPPGATIRVFYGMVNGIQLQHPRNKGRLVMPGWVFTNEHVTLTSYVDGSALMISDDGGETFSVGQVLRKNDRFGADSEPSESTVIELANGSLLINIRDSLNVLDGRDKTRCGCRLMARSDDGGVTFASTWREKGLVSSGVEGHMITTTLSTPPPARQVIWFVHPDSKTSRVNGTVFASLESGAPGSWQQSTRVPGEIWQGTHPDTFNFGYSMIVALPNSSGQGAAAMNRNHATQRMGVLYQNGWIANSASHYDFECNCPCSTPTPKYPETKLCGMLFATFEATLPQFKSDDHHAQHFLSLTGAGWTSVGGAWALDKTTQNDGSIAAHPPANSATNDTRHLLANDLLLHVRTDRQYCDFTASYAFSWPHTFTGAGFIFKAVNSSSFYWLDLPSNGIPSRDEYFPATLLRMTPSGWAQGLHMEWLTGISSSCCDLVRTVKLRVAGATIFISVNDQPLRPITIDDGEFTARKGYLGFAAYNQEAGIDPFGARFWNLSLTAPTAETPGGGSAGSEDEWATVPRAWIGIDPKVAYNHGGTGTLARDPVTGHIVYCCARPGYFAASSDNGRSFALGEPIPKSVETGLLRGRYPAGGKTAAQPVALESYSWGTNSLSDGGAIHLTRTVKINSTAWAKPEVVASITAQSLALAICFRATDDTQPGSTVAACRAQVNASVLGDWRYGGGGTPLLQLPGGELLLFANFYPPEGITHLNARSFWKFFASWDLASVLRSTDSGNSWGAPVSIDGRPPRKGAYGDQEDNKGAFAPMPMFADDNRVLTLGNGGPGARNWESSSSDGGLSWTPESRGPFYTTAAASVTTTSGVLVAAGRSPGGVTLHASFDGGRSWPSFFYVDMTGTWCNGDMMEVGPDEILFVYDGTDSGPGRQNRFQLIGVNRTQQWVGPLGSEAAQLAPVREGLTVSLKSDDAMQHHSTKLVRFGSPELVGSSASSQLPHFWFASGAAAVGNRLILPVRTTCDTPCYNKSTGVVDVIEWRADSPFPHSLSPMANAWSVAELVPSPSGPTVDWFSSSFVEGNNVVTTVQPHRASPTGPAASTFAGHATRWTVSNSSSVDASTVSIWAETEDDVPNRKVQGWHGRHAGGCKGSMPESN